MNKKILFGTAFLGATLISSVMAYETVWQKEDSNHPTSTEKNQRASEIRQNMHEKVKGLQEEEREKLGKVRELIKEGENEEARQIIQEYDFSQDGEDLLKRILQQSKRVGIQERLKNLDENERQERVEIIKKIRDLIRDGEIEKAKELRMEYDFVPSPSDK